MVLVFPPASSLPIPVRAVRRAGKGSISGYPVATQAKLSQADLIEDARRTDATNQRSMREASGSAAAGETGAPPARLMKDALQTGATKRSMHQASASAGASETAPTSSQLMKDALACGMRARAD